MSAEQFNAFLDKVKDDVRLQEKFKAATDALDVVAVAKEAGFTISTQDWENSHPELPEEDLENTSGGWAGCYISSNKLGICQI